MKKMLFEVEVHRKNSWDKYRVLATDDVTARERAIGLDNKFVEKGAGKIVYCETRLISKIDSA